MKKLFIGILLVALMFAFAPANVSAVTVEELQAMIASLTAQLNVLLAKQGNPVIQPVVEIINPTATSTGLVSFVERPTLKLVYDKNKSESSLEASANVYVDAGANDVLINYMSLFIGNDEGRQVFTNKRSAEFVGVSNTTKESVPSMYGSANDAWRVKAGTRATFKIKLIESPQVMFAGVYKASLGPVGILNKDGVTVYDQLAYQDLKSLPVTIIGEKSPYISGSGFKGTNVMISGVRFAKGDKVYINGVRKGVLTDVSSIGNNLINGAFPISWLDKSEKGGCMLYGNIQIENAKYGKSNNFGVSKGCDEVNKDFPQINAKSINSYSNIIKSVSGGSDEVVYTYNLYLTATNGDVYIPDSVKWVGSDMNRNFNYGANIAVERDGSVIGLDQYTPNVSYSVSNAQRVSEYWLIRDGQTSKVAITVRIGGIKQSGLYRASLVGFTYNNNPSNTNYRTHSIEVGKFATDWVYLNGSSVSLAQPVLTVLSPNGGESYKVGDSITINWQMNYDSSSLKVMLYSPIDGEVYTVSNLTGKSGTEKGLNLMSIPTTSVKPGQYKINVCDDNQSPQGLPGKSLCDISDNYFTIVSPTPALPVITAPTTTSPNPTIKTCYVGKSSWGRVEWTQKSCTGSDYLRAPADLKKEVIQTSEADKLNSIAASIQAIKEILSKLKI